MTLKLSCTGTTSGLVHRGDGAPHIRRANSPGRYGPDLFAHLHSPRHTGASKSVQSAHTLTEVHHIYVDSIGHDDEAVRFRSLLNQEPTPASFIIEDDSAEADAVLSGTFSVRVLAGCSRAYADVAARASDGATIWQSDFGPRFT